LGANKGFDATAAEEFLLAVLPRNGERFHFTRRQKMQKNGSAPTATRCCRKQACDRSIKERVQRRRDAIMEDAKKSNT
jgi:hypothetical protein